MNTKKKNYLKSNGMICPFCKSNDLVTGEFDFEGDRGFQEVICEKCKQSWTDEYTLTDVCFHKKEDE